MELERELAERLCGGHPADAARVLDALPLDDVASVLREVSAASSAAVLSRARPGFASRVLEAMQDREATRVLSELPPEDAAFVLRRVGPERRQRMLAELPERQKSSVKRLLSFPEHTAGALCDPSAITLGTDDTVDEALRRVREEASHAHYTAYVLEEDHRLVGALNLLELLAADGRRRLREIMTAPVVSVPASASGSAIASHPGWAEFRSLPVIDDQGRFVGAFRYGTLRRLRSELGRAAQRPRDDTAFALGDLFRAAVSGLVEAVTIPDRGDARTSGDSGRGA
jgi:magnesium transporter